VGELIGSGPQVAVFDLSAEEKDSHLIRKLIGRVIQDLGEKKIRVFQALGNVRVVKLQPRFFHFLPFLNWTQISADIRRFISRCKNP
jgi:hypothetical protein